MNSVLQIFLIGCAILFSTIVIRLLIKNKIGERTSVIWLGGVLVLFLLCSNPGLFDKVAKGLGIHYPPALLFFLASLILLTLSLYQTVQITKLSLKIKDISQYIALNSELTRCTDIQIKNESPQDEH
ncbi:DUF2304 domain-containing protein [Leptospira santarosai]|nr:DUF2304 domain-containing protein [Leptospira santarosai]